jgi:hypothetical protein
MGEKPFWKVSADETIFIGVPEDHEIDRGYG